MSNFTNELELEDFLINRSSKTEFYFGRKDIKRIGD